jgi:hypothetical protein
LRNSLDVARKWTEFVAHRPEFRPGQRLLQQFEAGEVVRLCDCGCNSYEFKLQEGSAVVPLTSAGERGGCAFALEFATPDEGRTVGVLVHVDAAGNLTGIDVDYCANSFPMPDNPKLVEPPLHVSGLMANAA